MSKTRKDAIRSNGSVPRNYTAMSMIVNGTGKSQVFTDRRNKRAKDYRNSWQHEQLDDMET